MLLRGAIFDFDGTLVDSMHVWRIVLDRWRRRGWRRQLHLVKRHAAVNMIEDVKEIGLWQINVVQWQQHVVIHLVPERDDNLQINFVRQ